MLNRQTREYRNTCVDRFNPSASNSSRADFAHLNRETYRTNNGQYPDSRRYW